GLVFRAVHPALSKDVAIKLSAAPLDDDPLLCEQVLAEGRLLATLDHPNLVRVYDCGLHAGHVFVVMEYVRGRSLDQYARATALAPRRAAALAAAVARCVAAVHRHGIVHQDLKPANVLVDEAGTPRLLDFGPARQRHLWADHGDEPAGGTPAYTSPEQARGNWDQVGPWSDVFALGGLLYFLLARRAPFAAPTRDAALHRAARCELDNSPLQAAR